MRHPAISSARFWLTLAFILLLCVYVIARQCVSYMHVSFSHSRTLTLSCVFHEPMVRAVICVLYSFLPFCVCPYHSIVSVTVQWSLG